MFEHWQFLIKRFKTQLLLRATGYDTEFNPVWGSFYCASSWCLPIWASRWNNCGVKPKSWVQIIGGTMSFSKWLLIHKWVDLCNDNSPGPDSLSHIYKQSILETKIHYSCKFFLETKAFQKAQLIFFPFWWRIFSFPLEKKQKQKVLNFVRKTVLLEKRKTRQLVNSKTEILEPKKKKKLIHKP